MPGQFFSKTAKSFAASALLGMVCDDNISLTLDMLGEKKNKRRTSEF
jgi:hypothetical protein